MMLYLGILVAGLSAQVFTKPETATQPDMPSSPVQVATDLWPGFTEPDGQGAYLHLIRVIFPTETEIQLRFTSFSRSILLVEQQQADMVIGISASDSDLLLLSDWPYDVDEIAVLFPQGQRVLDTKHSLTGLRLATQRGYNYAQLINIDSDSYEVDSIQTGVSLVKSQRVDAFLVEKSELTNKVSADELAGLELHFLKGEPIYMGFTRTERGLQLKQWWDYRYQDLLHSGQLEPLYQQYPNFILPGPASAQFAPTRKP